jgi:hypothetical protein
MAVPVTVQNTVSRISLRLSSIIGLPPLQVIFNK